MSPAGENNEYLATVKEWADEIADGKKVSNERFRIVIGTVARQVLLNMEAGVVTQAEMRKALGDHQDKCPLADGFDGKTTVRITVLRALKHSPWACALIVCVWMLRGTIDKAVTTVTQTAATATLANKAEQQAEKFLKGDK